MLVNCVVYLAGRRIAEPPVEQISDYLAQPDTFVWVAIKDPEPSELARMQEEFSLHPLAVEDAQRGHQRPKVEEYGDSLFVVLQTVECGESCALNMGEVDIFVGKNYVLSVRHKTQQGFADVRERTEREPKLLKHGPAFVLYALMDTVVDRYFPVVEKLEEELERIEERIFSKSQAVRSNIEELYELKRKSMHLHHALVPLVDATGKLFGGRVPPVVTQNMQEYFRDVSDHVMRVLRSVDNLREMTTAAVQVNLSLISLAESEITKKLASYGALFAAPTALAGIYGMNFKFMPELESPWGYPLVIVLMLFVDAVLWVRFRRSGWL